MSLNTMLQNKKWIDLALFFIQICLETKIDYKSNQQY